MPRKIDLKGQRFGRLVVLEQVPNPKGTSAVWLCLCDCGVQKSIASNSLRKGLTRSCGCLHQETLAERNFKHGQSKRKQRSPEYRNWLNMRNRCNNPKCPSYKDYGGRGITVDPRWDSFEAFLEDMGPRPQSNSSIERIDNSKGYSPENCCWKSPAEQTRNRRICIYVVYQGERMTLKEAARLAGVPYPTAYWRYKRRQPLEKVLAN